MAATASRTSKSVKSRAAEPRPLCGNPRRTLPSLSPTVTANPHRTAAILSTRAKWMNGTVLHYCFFALPSPIGVPPVQAAAVRAAFAAWKSVGIGLEFEEVKHLSEAEIRVGYSEAMGRSESAVGRQVLTVPLNEPTTQYGWSLRSQYGRGTALHELGHVLGMEHEHQNPYAGITWHEEAVYTSLGGPPNRWSRADTYHNILEKLTPEQVQGSQWDPNSIMEYPFDPGMIDVPDQYDRDGLEPPGTLSAADKAWARTWYPPLKAKAATLTAFESVVLELKAGEQVNCSIKPAESRKFTVETKGAFDTLMVLFEEVDGELRYLSGDDDSGADRNASISYKLFKGRSYVVRLRVYYPGISGTTSLVYY